MNLSFEYKLRKSWCGPKCDPILRKPRQVNTVAIFLSETRRLISLIKKIYFPSSTSQTLPEHTSSASVLFSAGKKTKKHKRQFWWLLDSTQWNPIHCSKFHKEAFVTMASVWEEKWSFLEFFRCILIKLIFWFTSDFLCGENNNSGGNNYRLSERREAKRKQYATERIA